MAPLSFFGSRPRLAAMAGSSAVVAPPAPFRVLVSVQAAAVVAKPDDKWGETPCAFVELKPGAIATADELIAWCRKHLAGYKCPRYVVFSELPKTSTGKIQKFRLRDIAKEG